MIEFREVTYRYEGTWEDVLSGLSLRLDGRGVVAIMGANGSGKSTAALCANGILLPTRGDVVVDGLNSREPGHRTEIRNRVGIVFQNPNLQFTSLTVERELAFGLENSNVPRDQMEEAVEETLGRFRLAGFRKASPASLSGGERQRVALAAVTINQPKYLIFDEATSLLSPESRRQILADAMATVKQSGTALIIITQFPEEAELADRLVVFDRGRVVIDDTPDSVFSNSSRLAQIGVPIPFRQRILLS